MGGGGGQSSVSSVSQVGGHEKAHAYSIRENGNETIEKPRAGRATGSI